MSLDPITIGMSGTAALTTINTAFTQVDANTTKLSTIQVHGANIASASTMNLETATGDVVDVTGGTTITAVTLSEGHQRLVRFTGSLLLTHGASLVLPAAANISTAAGDYALFIGYASSVVRVVYFPQDSAAGMAIRRAANAAAQTDLLSAMVGDSGAGGTKGLVPAPGAGDAAAGKFLKADGTFALPGSFAAPAIYYVETTGNNGTAAVGNSSLPYATGTAAYNAGVTAAVPFAIFGGVGTHTIAITSDLDTNFKQAIGRGRNLTIFNITGTPASSGPGAAGYNTTLNIDNLALAIAADAGSATDPATNGGSGGIHTITGFNSLLSVASAGASGADGDGGSGGIVRVSGGLKLTEVNLPAGLGGGMGLSGSMGVIDTADGCDLVGCVYNGATASIYGRCSYTAADITPSSDLACAAY
jgi:hypothetical protein